MGAVGDERTAKVEPVELQCVAGQTIGIHMIQNVPFDAPYSSGPLGLAIFILHFTQHLQTLVIIQHQCGSDQLVSDGEKHILVFQFLTDGMDQVLTSKW